MESRLSMTRVEWYNYWNHQMSCDRIRNTSITHAIRVDSDWRLPLLTNEGALVLNLHELILPSARCERYNAHWLHSHELLVCSSNILGSAHAGVGCSLDHNPAHLKMYLFEICFEIFGVRLLIICGRWTRLTTSFHKRNCPGKAVLFLHPFRSTAIVGGPIFPFKGMIGHYFGKFSRVYNVVPLE